MEFTASAIASFLKGKVEGDPEIKVHNVAKIEEAKEGELAFLANPKYAKYLYTTKASIVLINTDFTLEREVNPTLIRVENAYNSFASLLQLAQQAKEQKTGIEKMSHISDSAKIGKDVYIGAFAYIGENVTIGDDVKIYPNTYIGDNVTVGNGTTIMAGVKVYEECVIGNFVTIHAGAVIGADGFGFAPNSDNNYDKIPQIGNVILEDHVDIGANACIDRATMGSTIIRKGVKLDNLIQIGHNVEIGKHTVMAAQTGIAGSTKIGENCMFGGQVGVAGHINIAKGTKAAAMSGIASSVKKEDTTIMGAPAFDISDYRKTFVVFRRLPELRKQLMAIENELKELKAE